MNNHNNGIFNKRRHHTYVGVHDDNRPLHPYTIMTTGQVALACQVACRTVTKWCDGEHLKSHRIPLSRDRRIYLEDFVSFCTKHNIRIHPRYQPTKLVSYGIHKEECPKYVDYVDNPIELGTYLSNYSIRTAVIGDNDGLGYATVATRTILSLHSMSNIVLIVHEDIDANPLKSMGIRKSMYNRITVIKRPIYVDKIIEAIGIDPENRDISVK